MTPVRQTIFVADHPKGRGNCMSAALASILDLPLAEVIDLASDEVREGPRGFFASIDDWLGDRGLKFVSWWDHPNDDELDRSAMREALAGRYSIGSGPSPRGPFHHAIICKSGRMVWDPHPSDDGVTRIEHHQLIEPMTDAEKALHDRRRWLREEDLQKWRSDRCPHGVRSECTACEPLARLNHR